mmetsp:Transcript_25255/g.45736  ORF Transcript_25255/g.45736 Transcript_25255/m.45736 type:complete len:263 (+) Transcript_25255:819-1607(+)
MSKSLLLETTITVSTFLRRRSIASVAWRIRLRPSKPKGLVTMATVSAPDSLAISLTTGAAPDPVPPPMPAVTKHKSVPATMAIISSRLSSAANRPTSGSPPAPRPRVTAAPILSTCAPLALDRPSACASVLMAQNSTPATIVSSILSTALVPPPPTPSTLMTQGLNPPSGIRGAIPSCEASLLLRFMNPVSLRIPKKLTRPFFARCGSPEGPTKLHSSFCKDFADKELVLCPCRCGLTINAWLRPVIPVRTTSPVITLILKL